MISNTYNRYIWLLNTLIQYKHLSFDEIRYKWENSYLSDGRTLNLRTFHLHKNVVEEMFGVVIGCDASDGYKYYIEDTTSLQKDRARQWLINSFSISNMLGEGKMLHDRILLENIPEGSQYLSVLIESMRKNKELIVAYQPFYKDEPSTYHMQPYCMKVHHQRWYVLGLFNELGGLRHFAIDRVLNLEMTDVSFQYPKDFSPSQYYNDSIGIWINDDLKPEKVVIRSYELQSKYLRTLPLHHSQQEINSTDEYCDFQYKLNITSDLVRELLAKGSNIEVLEPENLKSQLLDCVDKIRNRYEHKVQHSYSFLSVSSLDDIEPYTKYTGSKSYSRQHE